MGLFDFFPYTSGHTLNLDWLIKQVKGFSSALAAHIDNKNNPHNVTAEQVNAAPAGYGLGTTATYIDDLNNATACGWYFGDNAANSPLGNLVLVEVFSHVLTSGVVQKIYCIDANNERHTQCIRYNKNGRWTEWEYINPPMLQGVEYLTTERYNGKAVYKYNGTYALPSALSETQALEIQTGISNMDICFKCEAKLGSYYLPFVSGSGTTTINDVTNGVINLVNNGPYWGVGYVLTFTLYYTKS